jgi:hypothetical protein
MYVDQLIAHMQRDLDARKIDAQLMDKNLRHANPIDLIEREKFVPATLDRSD